MTEKQKKYNPIQNELLEQYRSLFDENVIYKSDPDPIECLKALKIFVREAIKDELLLENKPYHAGRLSVLNAVDELLAEKGFS